jgi:hypothetical protein
VPATPHSFISRRTVRLQGHRQRGIWILRDGKIAVWETAFNVARADQAGGVAEMLGQAASRAGARERRRWHNARRASHTVIVPDGQISGSPVQPHLQKYFCFRLTQITSASPAIPAHTKGAFRDRHGRTAGMRWTRKHAAQTFCADERR